MRSRNSLEALLQVFVKFCYLITANDFFSERIQNSLFTIKIHQLWNLSSLNCRIWKSLIASILLQTCDRMHISFRDLIFIFEWDLKERPFKIWVESICIIYCGIPSNVSRIRTFCLLQTYLRPRICFYLLTVLSFVFHLETGLRPSPRRAMKT